MNRRLVLIFGAASGLFAFVGCGQAPGIPPSPFPPVSPSSTHTMTATGQARAALAGNYGGTLIKKLESGAQQSQAYTFALTFNASSEPISPGSVAGTIDFDSSGSIGTVNIDAQTQYLGGYLAGYDTDSQPIYSYVFVTSMVESPALSEYPVSLRLILSLKNNTVLVPTHSQIYFRDCVSAPYAPCTDMLNVSSGGDLGRR